MYTQNLRFLVAKEESESGTMETLTAADFNVRVRNPEVTPIIEPDDEASKYANGNHGEDEVVMGAQSGTIAFNVRMCQAGNATTEPKWWKFAYGCGAKKVTYGGTGIALQPLKENDTKTLSIWVFDLEAGGATPKGLCYQFAGCSGNMTMGAELGKAWIAGFTFTGKLVDIIDVAAGSVPAAVGIDTSHPEKMLQNVVTVGSVAQCISSFELDLGNGVTPIQCQSEPTGYLHYLITTRAPRISMDPIMKSVADEDVWGGLTSGLTGAIDTSAISLASNNFTLKVFKGQRMPSSVGNREGLVSWDTSFKCLANGVTGALAAEGYPPEATWQLLIGAEA